MEWFKSIFEAILKALFGELPKEEVQKPVPLDKKQVTHIPEYNEKSQAVGVMQQALLDKGYEIKVDDEFGPKTKEVLSRFQIDRGLPGSGIPGPKTMDFLGIEVVEVKPQDEPKKKGIPWFWELKKYEGKSEHDSAFNKFMSGFWAKVGLPGYTSIVGSARAWCGLAGAAGLIMAGYQIPVNSFRAKAWDNYCQAVDWKKNGIPQGAFIRINNKGDCNSIFDNHITHGNGDCAPQDIDKPSDVVSAYGGNQGDKLKVSNYAVRKICQVRWPCESELPKKITKSVNCSNGKTADNESTR